MKLLTYDQVDPLGVLHLNLLCLGYPLTPELAARLRRDDPRVMEGLGVYLEADGIVVGQVLLYRLPVVATDGPGEVGGICAVCTHPAFQRRGIAARLMDAAHARMRDAGLTVSTLGTTRYRVAHRLYLRAGYEDAVDSLSTLVRREQLPPNGFLRALRATEASLGDCDAVFDRAARGRLGFARRHPGFFALSAAAGEIDVGALWLLHRGAEPVGYATTSGGGGLLRVRMLLLEERADAPAAIAALSAAGAAERIELRVDEPAVAEALIGAGFPPPRRDWNTFMLRPLREGLPIEAARRWLGIDSGRFLISPIDQT
ncbi:MAG: GNAT family N-acetyltransferase [Candidatus Latescibacteria bacterium]|nr:GNAT family N-acetyltransferase [Candidatus Latescibacterota bacterium]